jgi:hypothetical protein
MKTSSRRVSSDTPYRVLISRRGFLFGLLHLERRIAGLFFTVALLPCLLSPNSAMAQDSRGIIVATERTALVIGNNAYQTAPLKNPVNDADDMSRALTSLGFRVTLLKNVDRRAMEDSIRSFGRQLKHGGVGLFYFAGHGMQTEGRNYLIPVNARIESESDIKYEAVDAGFVLGKMEDAANQLNIVVLDACRSNPFSRNFRSREQGLARLDAPTGSLIVYATAPGDVAADGADRNGIFTRHLLRHMQTPNLPVEQVLKRVRIDVAAETKHRQIPWESSSLMGDFYFKTEKVASNNQSVSIAAPKDSPDNQLSSTESEKPTTGSPSAGKTDKDSTGSSPSTMNHASLPPGVAPDVPNRSLPKLAVLPMYFQGSKKHDLSTPDVRRSVVEVFKRELKNRPDFQVSDSFYDLGKDLNARRIDPDIVNEESVNEMFTKDSIFSMSTKINHEKVANLAKKLNVELVFLFRFEPAKYRDEGHVYTYLINVANNKTYYDTTYIDWMATKDNSALAVERFLSRYQTRGND